MASRLIAFLAIFFLAMNVWSGVLISQGIAADLGIQASVGGDDAVDTAVDNASEIDTGAPTGSTLFGMYNVLGDAFGALSAPVTAGPTLLNQAGVPGWITFDLLQNIIIVVYAYGLVSILLQFDIMG